METEHGTCLSSAILWNYKERLETNAKEIRIINISGECGHCSICLPWGASVETVSKASSLEVEHKMGIHVQVIDEEGSTLQEKGVRKKLCKDAI